MPNDPLIIAGRAFRSRLMVGTGKFPSAAALKAALDASEAEIVTVALRRVDLGQPASDSILSVLDPQKVPDPAQHLRGPQRRGGRAPGQNGPGHGLT